MEIGFVGFVSLGSSMGLPHPKHLVDDQLTGGLSEEGTEQNSGKTQRSDGIFSASLVQSALGKKRVNDQFVKMDKFLSCENFHFTPLLRSGIKLHIYEASKFAQVMETFLKVMNIILLVEIFTLPNRTNQEVVCSYNYLLIRPYLSWFPEKVNVLVVWSEAVAFSFVAPGAYGYLSWMVSRCWSHSTEHFSLHFLSFCNTSIINSSSYSFCVSL